VYKASIVVTVTSMQFLARKVQYTNTIQYNTVILHVQARHTLQQHCVKTAKRVTNTFAERVALTFSFSYTKLHGEIPTGSPSAVKTRCL